MAISVMSASPTARNVVRVAFSEAFNQDSAFFEKSHWVFDTRFGLDVPIYAKQVTVNTATMADITLQDAMLTDGKYKVTVVGVSAISDGIPIEQGAGPNVALFDGDGDPKTCFDIKKRVPGWWNTRYGSNFYSLLCATGRVIDDVRGTKPGAAVGAAGDAVLLRTASDENLTIIGQNYGVDRLASSDDDLHRQLIPIFATKRKAVYGIFHDALTVLLGDKAATGWEIFTLEANVLLIVMSSNIFAGIAPGSTDSATYFHTDATEASPPSYPGDYFAADSSVAGSTLGDSIIVTFQQNILSTILNDLKASGIEIVVETYA